MFFFLPQIIDPQFRLNGTVPYLPEVMKTHEGKYYWKAPSVDFELNYIRLILKGEYVVKCHL